MGKEMDPSLGEGHRVMYDREVPFELRVQAADGEARGIATVEDIKCKILVLGDDNRPQHIRIEVASENDLFFHYTHNVDEFAFRKMQDGQKLTIDFSDYIAVLIRMLNNCIKHPASYLSVFVMQRDGSAQLNIIQNMEYKFIELLCCDFVASPDEVIRQ